MLINKASKGAQTIAVRADYERDGNNLTGKLLLHLGNTSQKAASIHITDNAYKAVPIRKQLHAQQEITVPVSLEHSHGWYDLTVSSTGIDASTHLAGRIETGKASISDPAMA